MFTQQAIHGQALFYLEFSILFYLQFLCVCGGGGGGQTVQVHTVHHAE